MSRPEGLNKKMVADLRRLCEYLDCLYRQSADYSQCDGEKVVDTVYWLYPPWKDFREYADCIFYSLDWCSRKHWRLRKHWRERLAQLEAELTPEPKPDNAVLDGHPPPQPRPDDAVLGGLPQPQPRPDDAVLGGQ